MGITVITRKIKIKQALFYNFWLKFIALIIAVTLWLLVSGMLGQITKGVRV